MSRRAAAKACARWRERRADEEDFAVLVAVEVEPARFPPNADPEKLRRTVLLEMALARPERGQA